ncbi:DUF2628 domain-containing protein [Roseomonas sp. GC11]|uniref:DUF2628 domain-containing protein n=1 Tax=Roseomonas sp. GC11 TaxID=2950546 RepID=UPI00210E0E0C|nr:DUF2628 domain-containing protein [Roseomonas sp. GC11]MCQ4160924.1 DUF2628 domain-containing protein [Roseomonas sp. GC11]
MRAFTLHLPAAPPAVGARRAGLAVVPEGFSPAAALLPGLWLLWHRQWLALVLYLALAVLAALLLPAPALGWAFAAAHLLLGLQAQDLRRWTLARQGRPVAAVILARDAEAALRRALEARPGWAALEFPPAHPPSAHPLGAPA